MEKEVSSDQTQDLTLNQASKSYLLETCKWAKLLAIVGFVFIGFMVIVAFSMGGLVSTIYELSEIPGLQYIGGTFVTIMYLAMALLYFFPTLYLYRFAVKTKSALMLINVEELSTGLENLKSTFKFMGILMIIMLGFYGIALIFMILGAVIGGAVGGDTFAT